MKIIYRYLFKKFLGPFALTFFFALFILLMQYLWKYVDDLVGKGLEISIILELLFYASATFVSLAAPLAVLLSSLMTFGSLGEQYEIIAIKSAGISIKKLISSLTLVSIIIAVGAFWFSDQVAPKAHLKVKSLLGSIRDQKPTLSIDEGVFYDGFDNYSIRVGKKDRNNIDIYDVLLFDHTKRQGNSTFIYAQRGRMQITSDQMYMLFFLYDGFSWDESSNSNSTDNFPLVRTTFAEQYKRFDISSFKFEKGDDDHFYSKSNQTLSNVEIKRTIDSTRVTLQRRNNDIFESFLFSCYSFKYFIYPDDVQPKESNPPNTPYNELSVREKNEMIARVATIKNDFKRTFSMNIEYKQRLYLDMAAGRVEWLRKYVLAVACIIFFFIGAPLGSIIRKGGIAVPLVITVAFFSSYFMLSVFGEKIAKGGAVPVWYGMWLSTFILIPICAFLTYQASADSALLSSEELHKKIQQINLKKIFTLKKNETPATNT